LESVLPTTAIELPVMDTPVTCSSPEPPMIITLAPPKLVTFLTITSMPCRRPKAAPGKSMDAVMPA